MGYIKINDNLCCDTCGYAIRGIMRGEYLEDFSDMEPDDVCIDFGRHV